MGISRTTVARELARMQKPYDPRHAQLDAKRKAKRPKPRKLDAKGPLRAYVVQMLASRWSPEQISKRIKKDFPDDEEMRISHEAIHQSLYVQGYGALRHELSVEYSLRTKRHGRKPASKLPAKNRPWLKDAHISKRPPQANDRSIPGIGKAT